MRSLPILSRLKASERRPVLGAALTLFGFMAGHALLETARDSLFLGALPARQLPWVYLAIAIGAFALGRVQDRFPPRLLEHDELRNLLTIAAVVTACFWLVADYAGSWVYYGLYTWSGILSTLVVVRFWTVLGASFTVTQAKRLFPLIGAASVTGAIAGSALARLIAEVAVARHLVLAAAIAFIATTSAPRLLRPRGSKAAGREAALTPGRDLSQVLGLIWQRPYLRRVAGLILLATLTFTLVDYVFKSAVDRYVPIVEMEEFFASVYLGLNVVSVAVQLLIVPILLRRLGSSGAQVLVPASLGLGAAGFAVLGGLGPALLLKAADGGLRHSLHRTTAELLFVPVTGELRARAKAFIDVLGQRGGQAIASLLILALLGVTGHERVFALLVVVCSAAWAWLALGLRRHYIDVFRETLRRDMTATRVEFPSLDAASVETLVRTLANPDDRKVMAALDVLADQGRTSTVPTMILFHPSSAVVLKALEHFETCGRRDHLILMGRLADHSDARVRAAVVRSGEFAPRALRRALADASPFVRATALVRLVGNEGLGGSGLENELQRLLSDGSEDAALALAQAMRSQPHPAFGPTLLRLSRSDHAIVRLEAVRGMANLESADFVPRLIELLGQRALRGEVRGALVAAGAPALEQLAATLADQKQPASVRRHVPKAIGAFRSPEAAARLIATLETETDGLLRFSILRALGRLRSARPELVLDAAVLERALDKALREGLRYMRWGHALSASAARHPRVSTPARELLLSLLRHKQLHAVERLFRVLDLLRPADDLQRLHRGLESANGELRATSRELLEGLTAPPAPAGLLMLVDDLYETGGGVDDGVTSDVDDAEILRRLLQEAGESLSAIAVFHIAELELATLVPDLQALRATASTPLVEVVNQTLAKLVGERRVLS